MSETNLFEIEFKDINENINRNIDPILLFKEIEQELSENLFKQEGGGDSTDGPLNFIEILTNNLQAELDETLGKDGDKKLFLRSLTKIFAILISIRADNIDKIKIIIKIVVKTAIRLWLGQN